jgi:enoyl-CoA hydratase/carnithine racemase
MMGTVYQALTYREDGHCRIVDLAEDLNSERVSLQFAELTEVCDRIAWDEQARVVVLGFNGVVPDPAQSDILERSSLVTPVAKLKQPVIAAIRGNATDLGLELALACDIRIAAEGACFGFQQIREGRVPSNGGTQRLPRLIGQAKAMQLILTGELMDADEAQRAGLVHRIAASNTPMNAAMDMAHDMAEKSPLSLSYVKEALYAGRDLTLDQGLKMELDLYLLLFSTFDRTEGVTAFKEKRKPKFEGI